MNHLRTLFWLKWKLLLRGYRRSMSALVGALVLCIFVFPVALTIAFGLIAGFITLQPPFNAHLLRAALLGIYALWLFGPLLGFALSDSYDVSKLFVYPMSVTRMFVGVIVSSVLDLPVLFLLPALVGVVVAFSHAAASLLVVSVCVVLFLFHTLALSQALVLASAGVLRSRRYREVATIAIAVVSMFYYVGMQFLARRAAGVDVLALVRSPVWEVINYLPPGLAARAIAAASQGEFAVSLAYAIILGGITAATLSATARVLAKVYAGEDSGGPIRRPLTRGAGGTASRARRREEAPPEQGAAGLVDRLPGPVRAMMDKELRYLTREPFFKMMVINVALALLVYVIMMRTDLPVASQPMVVWSTSFMLLFLEMRVVCNMLGTDGSAAAVLFLFPAPRRQILLGKNVANWLALCVVDVLGMGFVTAAAGALPHLPLIVCWMILAVTLCIAAGNIVSIYFPMRQVAQGRRILPQAGSKGCLFALVYLAVTLALFLVLLPVLAALVIPAYLVRPIWLALSVPFAVAYAVGLYAVSLRVAEPLLMSREGNIIAGMTQED